MLIFETLYIYLLCILRFVTSSLQSNPCTHGFLTVTIQDNWKIYGPFGVLTSIVLTIGSLRLLMSLFFFFLLSPLFLSFCLFHPSFPPSLLFLFYFFLLFFLTWGDRSISWSFPIGSVLSFENLLLVRWSRLWCLFWRQGGRFRIASRIWIWELPVIIP